GTGRMVKMPKNPCAKRVTPETAYEVWQSYDGRWTYFVLKKYQSPEKEANNPFARWLCNVVSPMTSERGDTGDVYVADIKRNAVKLDHNPLKKKSVLCQECHDPLTEQELAAYSLQWQQ